VRLFILPHMSPSKAPANISELIDRLDQIRRNFLKSSDLWKRFFAHEECLEKIPVRWKSHE
jgi:hypothetical protein